MSATQIKMERETMFKWKKAYQQEAEDHVRTSNNLQGAIKDLESKLSETEKKLEIAISGLNYYANKYRWQGTHIGPSDYWFDNTQGYFFGGLKAREALEKIGNTHSKQDENIGDNR